MYRCNNNNLLYAYIAVKDLFERTEQELYLAREQAIPSIPDTSKTKSSIFKKSESDIHIQMKIKVGFILCNNLVVLVRNPTM